MVTQPSVVPDNWTSPQKPHYTVSFIILISLEVLVCAIDIS